MDENWNNDDVINNDNDEVRKDDRDDTVFKDNMNDYDDLNRDKEPHRNFENTSDDVYADGTPANGYRRTYHFDDSDPASQKPGYDFNNREDRYYRDEQAGKTKRKAPKKNSKSNYGEAKFGKKVLLTAIIAVIFGLVAGLVFVGVTSVAGVGKKAEEKVQIQADDNSNLIYGDEKNAEETQEDTLDNGENITDGTVNDVTSPNTLNTLSVADVADEAMPSMVSITNMSVQQVQSWFGNQSYEAKSAGTGIIVGKTDTELLIATNQHVVSDYKTLSVCFIDQTAVDAVVKGEDEDLDLAIVAVKLSDIPSETMDAINVIKIGSSDDIRVGEDVVAIGNALGYGQSVSAGIVSAKERHVDGLADNLIVTDAAINPGNSGGALLNMDGELVGINEAKSTYAYTEGVGYAIPISQAKPILDELMNRVTRDKADPDKAGFLGIANSYNIDSTRAEQNDAPQGVYVQYLIKDGAAAKAGIRPGDIITKVDGYSVNSLDSLREELAYYEAGESVEITLYRYGDNGYEEMTLSAVLTEKMEDPTVDDTTNGSSDVNGQDSDSQNPDAQNSTEQVPSDGSVQQSPGNSFNDNSADQLGDQLRQFFGW